MVRGAMSGDMRVEPSGKTILQGSILSKIASTPQNHKCKTGVTYVKGSAQYTGGIDEPIPQRIFLSEKSVQ